MSRLALGNGLVEAAEYNGLLQLTNVRLETVPPVPVWELQNGYSSTANNGNILTQTQTLAGETVMVTTHYRYDPVNRLELAVEQPQSSSPVCPDPLGSHWCQQYGYDARGNRWIGQRMNSPMSLAEPLSSESFGSNNRIAEAAFTYDAAGNLTWSPMNDRYAYDGENRQIGHCTLDAALCPPLQGSGRTQYGYDGEGRRVTKTSLNPANQTVTIVYAYDARGQLAAEYGGTVGTPGTQYRTVDHLGSTRVVTDASGVIVTCRDYFPFGEEITANTDNGRDGINCYSGDTRLKFTGKERDEESRLDYFGARYFSWAQGRFTSPDYWPDGLIDPHTGKPAYQPGPLPFADIADPQTHNQYVSLLSG